MRAVFTHITGVKRGEREALAEPVITVGRAPSSTLSFAVTDTRASAHHAEITFDGTGYLLRDIGSTNGTYVNGQRVHSVRLRQGDVIEFGTGGPQVRFEAESESGMPMLPALLRTESDFSPVDLTVTRAPSKEFGRTTTRLMIEQAVRKTSTQFRVMVSALVLLVVVLSATTAYLAYRERGPEGPGPDWGAIAKANQGAVVFIYTRFALYDQKGTFIEEEASTGSGFVVSEDGQIITNRHVIRFWEYDEEWARNNYRGEIREIKVIFADHRSDDAIPAEVVRISDSTDTDVAVLRVKAFPAMPVLRNFHRDTTQLRQGDPIGVIGYPLGADLFEFTGAKQAETSFSQGFISRVTGSKIQIDAAANPGNSGGPVFDAQGRVIGILTQGLAKMGAQNINFATPIGVALDMIEQPRSR